MTIHKSIHASIKWESRKFNRFLKASIRKLCQDDMADWDQVLGQILMAYRCFPHTSTGESPFFLVYNRNHVLPVHKLISPVTQYRGDMTIPEEIEKQNVTLNTAAKMLEKKKEDKKKSSMNRPSHQNFQIGDLVLGKKHNKEKFELKWEPGYRTIDFPTKWTVRVRNKESGEPRCFNIKDLRHKDPAAD